MLLRPGLVPGFLFGGDVVVRGVDCVLTAMSANGTKRKSEAPARYVRYTAQKRTSTVAEVMSANDPERTCAGGRVSLG